MSANGKTRFPQIFGMLIALATATVGADEPRLPKVGELYFGDRAAVAYFQNGFREGLRELGYVNGRNIVLLTGYADGSTRRLNDLVAKFVAEKVDVMFITVKAVPLAKKLTSTIPIVSAGFVDPVGEGHADTLARPGRNITGVSWQSPDASAKRLQLAIELIRKLKRVAVLVDPEDPSVMVDAKAFHQAATAAGVEVRAIVVSGKSDLEKVLAKLLAERPQALVTADLPAVSAIRVQLVRFALDHRIPVVSETKVWAEDGALVTYGPSGAALYKRAAHYVDRILKGAKPGDLPIEQPTTFELVVNLKTAKVLGITIPEPVLLRADEVIR